MQIDLKINPVIILTIAFVVSAGIIAVGVGYPYYLSYRSSKMPKATITYLPDDPPTQAATQQ